MHLEIVSHCWQYSRLLTYQLSSLVLFPPKELIVTQTVFYAAEDRETCAVLEFFGALMPPNISWRWRCLERQNLMRRTIGRNLSALETTADWIWFADADMCFRHNCLDRLAEILAGQGPESRLVFPRCIQISKSHMTGDAAIAAASGHPRVIDVDPRDFVPWRYRRAIGGVQICRGDVARERGYCNGFRRHLLPAERWQSNREDVTFRRILGTPGIPIKLEHVYRIRHSTRGQENPSASL